MKKNFLALDLDKNRLILTDKNNHKNRYYYLDFSFISIINIKNKLFINIYELIHSYFDIFYIKLNTKIIYMYTRKDKSLIIIDDGKRHKYYGYNIHNKYYYKKGYFKLSNIKENDHKRCNDLKFSSGSLNLVIYNEKIKDKIFIKDAIFFLIKRMYD